MTVPHFDYNYLREEYQRDRFSFEAWIDSFDKDIDHDEDIEDE